MPLHIAQCVWCTFIEHDTSPSSVVHFLADLSMWQCFWLESHIGVWKDKILKNGLKMHSLNTFNAVRLHSVPFNMKCWCHRFQQPIPCAITVSFSFKKIQFHHRVRMLLFLVFFSFFHIQNRPCIDVAMFVMQFRLSVFLHAPLLRRWKKNVCDLLWKDDWRRIGVR